MWSKSNALQDAESGDVEAQVFMAARAMEDGQHGEALCWFERAANQGDVRSMVALCRMYEYGTGIDVGLVSACHWMKKILDSLSTTSSETSSENGNDKDAVLTANILYSYGSYLLGASTPVDWTRGREQTLPESMLSTEQGLRYLEKAATLGHVDAASKLGNIYMTGPRFKIPMDINKAIKWYINAAELGNGVCAYQLAITYRCGVVPANPTLEKKWLKVAVRLGCPEAQERLDNWQATLLSSDEAEKRLRVLKKGGHVEACLFSSNQCSNPKCNKQEGAGTTFSFCSACRSVQYCSKECQITHYRTGHKKSCAVIVANKEELITLNRNCLLPFVERCSFPECNQKQGRNDVNLQRCSRCKSCRYCSRECQTKHWNSGHKADCDRIVAEKEDIKRIFASAVIGY